jgi:hypothetical protein
MSGLRKIEPALTSFFPPTIVYQTTGLVRRPPDIAV